MLWTFSLLQCSNIISPLLHSCTSPRYFSWPGVLCYLSWLPFYREVASWSPCLLFSEPLQLLPIILSSFAFPLQSFWCFLRNSQYSSEWVQPHFQGDPYISGNSPRRMGTICICIQVIWSANYITFSDWYKHSRLTLSPELSTHLQVRVWPKNFTDLPTFSAPTSLAKWRFPLLELKIPY